MKKPYIVGITGGSGSGKTLFISKLEQAFKESDSLCVISQDNYYRSREEQLIDVKGIRKFDLPISIDHEHFAADIKKLIAGKTVHKEEYTFNNALVKPKQLVFEPKPIIVVEGIFVFHFTEIDDLMDYRVFIDASKEVKLNRRIQRDAVERNYPKDDVLYRYENHVVPTYNEFIEPHKERADFVVDNNISYVKDLGKLVGHLKAKLA